MERRQRESDNERQGNREGGGLREREKETDKQ